MVSSPTNELLQALSQQGWISQDQLEQVQEYVRSDKSSAIEALVTLGAIPEGKLLEFIAHKYHIPLIDLDPVSPDPKLANLLPKGTAQRYLAIPLYRQGRAIVVAMADAWNIDRVDDIRFAIGQGEILPILASREAIQGKLGKFYNLNETVAESNVLQQALHEMEDVEARAQQETETSVEKLRQESATSPTVKVVNDIFIRAIHQGASDIHIEPREAEVSVRFRVDGVLRAGVRLPLKAKNAVISRIKVLGGMDISVTRKPQDGRIKLTHRNRPLDMRISTLPTFWGEKVVMRILDKSGAGLDLDRLGFLHAEHQKFDELIRQPQGLFLVTGPTGSGKTTTLYAALRTINNTQTNIITLEDPVEYQLPGINQVPVNPKAGMSFAAGLRAILRQDPDIIMVGEIRDHETAEIAMEAAETGHMVFSTLHTNSASGAATRILDMGIPGYLLASSLSGVLAQRLLRCNCPECSEPVEVPDPWRAKYKIPEATVFYEGRGCSACHGTGRKGRIGIYELLLADKEVKEGLYEGINESELVDRARRSGMHLMFEDGLIKAMQGKVAFNEVRYNIEFPAELEINAERLLEQAENRWEERGMTIPRTPAPSQAKTRSIFVIGGTQRLLHLIKGVLAAEGFEVETIESGRQGLFQTHQHPPELMIAHRQTPEMDGLSLCQAFKRHSEHPPFPVIILGENNTPSQEIEALEAGADDYLPLPLEPDRLIARVKRLADLYTDLRGDSIGKAEPAPRKSADG